MSRLQRGMARLAERLLLSAPTTITYSDGTDSVTLTVLEGDKLLRTTDEYGNVRTERTDKDFLIRPSELILGGVLTRPARGHTARHVSGGVTYVYKVLPYADEPVYRDRMLGEMYRVHCKLVSDSFDVPALALLDGLGDPLLDGPGDYLLGGA
jgi:hypothetical protein